MVFIVHFGQRIELTGTIRNLTDFGAFGVQLFFIISGYLACSSLCNRTVNIKKYYLKRLIRIAPLYYFVVFWFFSD